MKDEKQENVWGENLGSKSEPQDVQQDKVNPVIDFETAMQFIIDERNNAIVEFNEIFDENESMRNTLNTANDLADKHIDLIKENNDLKNQHQQLFESHESLLSAYNKVIKNNESLASSTKSTMVNYELLKGQKATVDKKYKVTQTELKKLKKLSAGHKSSNDTLRKQVARLTKELKEERTGKGKTGDIPQLNTIYEVDDEVLIVYPQRHKMNNGDSLVEQTVLLYTDMRGVYLTVCLDDDNQAVFSSPLNKGGLSDRTVATYRKHSISPSETVRDYATQWLYRVNVGQNMKVERFDLMKFTGE